ncbi:MAG: DUF721 domain-containing protein [Parachlamydiales bacterium]|nr:DUF721 domain-containing protein [Parachlamydiales bacterium]
MEKNQTQQSYQILQYWYEIVGEKLSPLTQAVSLKEGVLTVRVKSTTLYSLFCQHEKYRLLGLLQKKFSKDVIRSIKFRMG